MAEPKTIDPDLHDGTLVGLVVRGCEHLELLCADASGFSYVVTLDGLIALRAENFRQSNIISGFSVYLAPIPRELVKRTYGDESDDDPPWLAEKMSALAGRAAVLLEVTSSYGCELLALASQEPRIVRRL